MLRMILQFIGGIAEAIGGFFKWKAAPNTQYSAAEKAVEKNDAAIAKKKAEAEEAAYGGDEMKVNTIINGIRAVAFALLFFAGGCFSDKPSVQVVRVTEDRWVRAVTNELGKVSHWEVPPSVMTELLDAKIERDELLKKQRIQERLNVK